MRCQVRGREPRKRQDDESGNCAEHFLCPSAQMKKGHQEHLPNYARKREENSSKHTPKTNHAAADQGSLGCSKSRGKK